MSSEAAPQSVFALPFIAALNGAFTASQSKTLLKTWTEFAVSTNDALPVVPEKIFGMAAASLSKTP